MRFEIHAVYFLCEYCDVSKSRKMEVEAAHVEWFCSLGRTKVVKHVCSIKI